MIRRSIIPRILIPAVLIAAAAFSLLGRLVFAQSPTTLLRDDVAVQSCGATWTTDRRWIACGTILRDGFD